jgi:hypothetical protein
MSFGLDSVLVSLLVRSLSENRIATNQQTNKPSNERSYRCASRDCLSHKLHARGRRYMSKVTGRRQLACLLIDTKCDKRPTLLIGRQ